MANNEQTSSAELHLGQLIKAELARQGRTAVWLAKQVDCTPENIYKACRAQWLTMPLLFRISRRCNMISSRNVPSGSMSGNLENSFLSLETGLFLGNIVKVASLPYWPKQVRLCLPSNFFTVYQIKDFRFSEKTSLCISA